MCKLSQTNIDNNLVLYYGMPNCLVIRKKALYSWKSNTANLVALNWLCTLPLMYMTAKKSNELATDFCLGPCRNGEQASFPGPSMIPCSVQTVPLCRSTNWRHEVWEWGYDELETWSLGMRLWWTGDMKSGLRWTSYTSNHDKKDNYLTVIKLFLNSQDIVCFARHSV